MKKKTKRPKDRELNIALFGVMKYGRRNDGIFLSADEIISVLERAEIYNNLCEETRIDAHLVDAGYFVKYIRGKNYFNVEFIDELAIASLNSFMNIDNKNFAVIRKSCQEWYYNQ
jgi:hypothetical protein